MKKISFGAASFAGLFLLISLTACSFSFNLGGAEEEAENIPDSEQTSNNQDVAPDGYLTYTNTDSGVKVNYPKDWEKRENFSGTILMVLAQPESDMDLFQENVNILLEELPSAEITLDEYKDASTEQIELGIENYSLIDLSKIDINGTPGYKITYSGSAEGYNYKWLQVFCVKDSTAYIMTYTADADANGFEKFLPQVQEMINSFSLI